MNGNMIYFSDFFDVATEILDDYGAFNISMLNRSNTLRGDNVQSINNRSPYWQSFYTNNFDVINIRKQHHKNCHAA